MPWGDPTGVAKTHNDRNFADAGILAAERTLVEVLPMLLFLPFSLESLLAPTGALILMMVRDISVAAPAFSDFEHLCLSILLQVSL